MTAWAAASGVTLEEEEAAVVRYVERLDRYPQGPSVQNVNPAIAEHLKALRAAIKKKNSD